MLKIVKKKIEQIENVKISLQETKFEDGPIMAFHFARMRFALARILKDLTTQVPEWVDHICEEDNIETIDHDKKLMPTKKNYILVQTSKTKTLKRASSKLRF